MVISFSYKWSLVSWGMYGMNVVNKVNDIVDSSVVISVSLGISRDMFSKVFAFDWRYLIMLWDGFIEGVVR